MQKNAAIHVLFFNPGGVETEGRRRRFGAASTLPHAAISPLDSTWLMR